MVAIATPLSHECDANKAHLEFTGLVSPPYNLRSFLLGLYQGEALMMGGHILTGKHLIVPINMAAVIVLANGDRVKLTAGKYPLGRLLKYAPIGAQFIRMQHHPFLCTIKIKNWGQLELGLRINVNVTDPLLITQWKEPLTDVEALVSQTIIIVAANSSYEDCLRKMPELLLQVCEQVDARCRARGLSVTELVMTHLEPEEKNNRELEHEWKMRELELREIELKRQREVELRETQKDEDVFALRQPSLRRMVSGQIHAALREQNFQARMKSIETLNTIVQALLEERRKQPGQLYGEDNNKVLADALAMLEKLATPVNAPPIPQQVRSKLAVDPNQPEPPPVADPIGPDDLLKP